MVITARRAQPGAERAQLLVDGAGGGPPGAPTGSAAGSSPAAKTTNQAAATKARSLAASQASDLLRQIRVAEAQGQPSDQLRQQLYQAVEAMKP